jgi:hypothetical protein
MRYGGKWAELATGSSSRLRDDFFVALAPHRTSLPRDDNRFLSTDIHHRKLLFVHRRRISPPPASKSDAQNHGDDVLLFAAAISRAEQAPQCHRSGSYIWRTVMARCGSMRET